MRGSVSYSEIAELTLVEKQIMSEFINARLEKEFKKKGGSHVY